MTDRDIIHDLIAAAGRLASGDGWGRVSLAAAAREAGVTLSAARALAPDLVGLFAALAERADIAAAAALDAHAEPEPANRLFDAAMARFDALIPVRDFVASFYKHARRDPVALARLAPIRARTIASLLEVSDIPSSGPQGARRMIALGRIWGRAFDVWLNDGPEQAKTMAELDQGVRKSEHLWGATATAEAPTPESASTP